MNLDLPPDLAAIEQALVECAGSARAARGQVLHTDRPDDALRGRVLASVNDELGRSERIGFWQYAAGVAAAVLLLLNLSLAASPTLPPAAPLDAARVDALSRQIQQMDLTLSPAEIRRQALLLTAAGRIIPLARPYGSASLPPEISR